MIVFLFFIAILFNEMKQKRMSKMICSHKFWFGCRIFRNIFLDTHFTFKIVFDTKLRFKVIYCPTMHSCVGDNSIAFAVPMNSIRLHIELDSNVEKKKIFETHTKYKTKQKINTQFFFLVRK